MELNLGPWWRWGGEGGLAQLTSICLGFVAPWMDLVSSVSILGRLNTRPTNSGAVFRCVARSKLSTRGSQTAARERRRQHHSSHSTLPTPQPPDAHGQQTNTAPSPSFLVSTKNVCLFFILPSASRRWSSDLSLSIFLEGDRMHYVIGQQQASHQPSSQISACIND